MSQHDTHGGEISDATTVAEIKAILDDHADQLRDHELRMDGLSTAVFEEIPAEEQRKWSFFTTTRPGAGASAQAMNERLDRILRYVGEKAAAGDGRASVSKHDVYEDVFDGDDGAVSLRTVSRYLGEEMPKAPGVSWVWTGPGTHDSTGDRQEGKRLRFSFSKYKANVDDV